MKMKEWCDM